MRWILTDIETRAIMPKPARVMGWRISGEWRRCLPTGEILPRKYGFKTVKRTVLNPNITMRDIPELLKLEEGRMHETEVECKHCKVIFTDSRVTSQVELTKKLNWPNPNCCERCLVKDDTSGTGLFKDDHET